MSWRVQVRYSGTGPHSGMWLNAYEQRGFMVNDKHATQAQAVAEAKRLRGMSPQFTMQDTDWEIRVHQEGAPESRPAPAPPPPPPSLDPEQDPSVTTTLWRPTKKKAKKKTT